MRRLVASLLLVAAAHGATAQEIRTRDLADREIVLAGPARRIVALPAPSAPTVMSMDLSARHIVGMHPSIRAVVQEGLMARLFPEALGIETSVLNAGAAGFMPNIETVAGLHPDLVLQRGERGEDIIGPLTNAGLKTALVIYGDEETTRRNLQLAAEIVGKPERGRAILAWRDGIEARLKRDGATISERPSVLFLSRPSGRIAVTAAGTPNDLAITLAGGRNAAAEFRGSASVSAEQMMLWNPQVILLNSQDRNLGAKDITEDPILSGTDAARDHRVYKVPVGAFRWEPPNQENPFFWLWLSVLLHPEAFAYDMRAELRTGMALLYGREPDPAELDAMLLVKANAGTMNYERIVGK